jgi:hypothetical protein
MKATIEFNLDEMDDVHRHHECVNASKMACFIWELKHNFWRKWKHDDTDFNLDTYKEALHELMEEHNINPDELYQ